MDLVDHLAEPIQPATVEDSEQTAQEMDQGHDVDYVPILTAQGLLQGTQARSFLEANNIPTLVYGETVRKTHGIVIDGVGATTILVPRELADTARELLAKADRGEFEIEDSSE